MNARELFTTAREWCEKNRPGRNLSYVSIVADEAGFILTLSYVTPGYMQQDELTNREAEELLDLEPGCTIV